MRKDGELPKILQCCAVASKDRASVDDGGTMTTTSSSDLLSKIVRADLPAFTDNLLERLLSRQDVQVRGTARLFYLSACSTYLELPIGALALAHPVRRPGGRLQRTARGEPRRVLDGSGQPQARSRSHPNHVRGFWTGR